MSSLPPVNSADPAEETPTSPNEMYAPDARDDKLLTPHEVATMFNVSPKTVARWHQTGKISAVRTPGGHRRFYAREIYALLGESETR